MLTYIGGGHTHTGTEGLRDIATERQGVRELERQRYRERQRHRET